MIVQLFARRYLFSRSSRSVINIISGVSIGAIAVPVCAMIILLSVFNGFEELIRSMRSSFDADLTVTAARGISFDTADLDKERMLAVDGAEAASYIIEQQALAGYGDEKCVVTVRGADDDYASVLPADETVVSGEFSLRHGEIDRIVVGRGVAYNLRVRSFVTDDVSLYALRRKTFSTLLPVDGWASVSLPVSAVYAIDAETDGSCVLTSLSAARRLFDLPDRATALCIRAGEGVNIRTLKERLQEAAGDGFRVTTRDEANASLYKIMRYEKWSIFVIALFVLTIASLSLVGVLVMLIIEKRTDIATLRTLGADTALLRSIFRSEGMLISLLGGGAGLCLGIVLCLVQQWFGVITIPAETMVVDTYPVQLKLIDVAITAAVFAAVARGISAVTVNTMIKSSL